MYQVKSLRMAEESLGELPYDVQKQWDIILLVISSEESKIIRNHDSEIDTMTYFLNNKGIRKILYQWLWFMFRTNARKQNEIDTPSKCDEVSELWRLKGNESFKMNLLPNSYYQYTKSLMFAVYNGPMFPLAAANRSAVLLRLKKFPACLSDIALALSNGYPEELKYKLLLRRVNCYLEMNQLSEAREALVDVEEFSRRTSLSPEVRDELLRQIDDLKVQCNCHEDVEHPIPEDEVPELYKGSNPNFQNASNAVQLNSNQTSGRFVVTKEETNRGDVLFSEEPYAWVRVNQNVCDYCCETHINRIPCKTCSRAQYCSNECLEQGQTLFHQYECVGMQMNLFDTIGIAHLGLRVFLMAVTTGFPPINGTPRFSRDLFEYFSNVDKVDIYKEDTHPFYRVFHLLTNFPKMANVDYIQYAITATALVIYLETFTDVFDHLAARLPKSMAGEQFIFAGAIILRALGQMVCNGHAILSFCSLYDDDERIIDEEEHRSATAIYPSAAMMNHACDPNIINAFFKRRLVIRCARGLAAGAEVLNCYGPHKARLPTKTRLEMLRAQYLFNCTCPDCTDPERKDFALLFSAYACQSCKGPITEVTKDSVDRICPACGTSLDINRYLIMNEQANDLMEEALRSDDPIAQCNLAMSCLRLQQHVFHRHNSVLRTTMDTLAKYWADRNEYTRSIELIKQNIQTLEYQFGSFSCEVAHELRKLARVMFNRIMNTHTSSAEYREWCLEAHKIFKKSVQLMTLNFGPWMDLVKDLKSHERFLSQILAANEAPNMIDGVHHDFHYNLKI